MGQATELFDQSPAPTRTLGMMLGASGVSAPSVQIVGSVANVSTADGSFSDVNGYGQIDYDSAGYMYVCDISGNRVQRFVKNSSGAWIYDSKVASLGTLIGGGTNSVLVAIDRSRNQIHLGMLDHYTASNWISVWNLSDWPSLTTGNRVRQYGANASSNTADRALQGVGLTIDDTYAVVTSLGTPYRQLRWNHVTGVLQNQDASAVVPKGRWTTDGAGNWWTAIGFNAGSFGLYKADPSTFAAGTRLDVANAGGTFRRNRFHSGAPLAPVYSGGRVYARSYIGNLMAWSATDNSYVDEFAQSGNLGNGDVALGSSAWAITTSVTNGKSGIVVDADGCAWLVSWANNANNANSQSFLLMQPLSAAVATWTKTDWSTGVNTLQSIVPHGLHLSGEKWKIRLKKNSGSWITFTTEDVRNSAFFSSLGTFTSGDTLTVELSLSTWDRLDFASGVTATRDKLAPSNIAVQLTYEDTEADVYVPYETGAIKAKLGGTGAFRAKIGG